MNTNLPRPSAAHSRRTLLALGLACGFTQLAHAQGTATRSGAANYPSSTQVGQATISTDPETRKLVVVTDDKTAEDIGR
jgi:hypothetical protein